MTYLPILLISGVACGLVGGVFAQSTGEGLGVEHALLVQQPNDPGEGTAASASTDGYPSYYNQIKTKVRPASERLERTGLGNCAGSVLLNWDAKMLVTKPCQMVKG